MSDDRMRLPPDLLADLRTLYASAMVSAETARQHVVLLLGEIEALLGERERLRDALDALNIDVSALAEVRQFVRQRGREPDDDYPLSVLVNLGDIRAAVAALAEPAPPAAPDFSVHIHGSHLMPVETQDALMRAAGHIIDAYKAGWRPNQPGPIRAPYRCAHGHVDCCGHHDPQDFPVHEVGACPVVPAPLEPAP